MHAMSCSKVVAVEQVKRTSGGVVVGDGGNEVRVAVAVGEADFVAVGEAVAVGETVLVAVRVAVAVGEAVFVAVGDAVAVDGLIVKVVVFVLPA